MENSVDNILSMLNKFLSIYNIKHKKISNMFDGYTQDPVSTNDITEMFYEYMTEYNSKKDNHNTDVYEYTDDLTIDNKDSDDIYAIIEGKESKIKYISLSYISLLSVGCKTKGLDNWTIIKM